MSTTYNTSPPAIFASASFSGMAVYQINDPGWLRNKDETILEGNWRVLTKANVGSGIFSSFRHDVPNMEYSSHICLFFQKQIVILLIQ